MEHFDRFFAALGLELKQEWTEKYHYAELVRDGRYVVGIAQRIRPSSDQGGPSAA